MYYDKEQEIKEQCSMSEHLWIYMYLAFFKDVPKERRYSWVAVNVPYNHKHVRNLSRVIRSKIDLG